MTLLIGEGSKGVLQPGIALVVDGAAFGVGVDRGEVRLGGGVKKMDAVFGLAEVQRHVVGDGEDPGTDVADFGSTALGLVHAQENFLGGLLGLWGGESEQEEVAIEIFAELLIGGGDLILQGQWFGAYKLRRAVHGFSE